MNNPQTRIPFFLGIIPIITIFVIMLFQVSILKIMVPHVAILCGIIVLCSIAIYSKYPWQDIENSIYKDISSGLPAIGILILIGIMIATWIMSGTVPFIIYHGLNLISPKYFLISATLICIITSIVTGTSWGTIGTVGIALVGIAEANAIPVPLACGAIISGAYFGDKMSPLSDTTNLTSSLCRVNLFSHIKNMFPTTIPATIIALILYFIIGLNYGQETVSNKDSQIPLILSTLKSSFNFTYFLLIPPVLIVILSIKKVPALLVIFIGILSAILCAAFFQGSGITQIIVVIKNGYTASTGVLPIDTLLSKGGIDSMMSVIILSILALAFGSLLKNLQITETILEKMQSLIQSDRSLRVVSILTPAFLNVVICDIYLTIILTKELYIDEYDKRKVPRLNLSRSIEEGGTFLNPLVPWASGGIFAMGVFGISTFEYAQYAFICWLSPLIGLILAFKRSK